jgi:hypothetical protein
MKGTSAPQTGDIKAGQGIGNAQVWDLSAKDKRINDLVDRDLDAKAAEEAAKKKEDKDLKDKFLAATDTSGMHREHIPTILKDIETLYAETDMYRYTNDASYRAVQNQKLANIRSGVKASVDDKNRYHEQIKYNQENPNQMTDPTLDFSQVGSSGDYTYGNFSATQDGVPIYKRKELRKDKLIRYREGMNIIAKSGEREAGGTYTSATTKMLDDTWEGYIVAEQNDPEISKDYAQEILQSPTLSNEYAKLDPTQQKEYLDNYIRDEMNKMKPDEYTSKSTTTLENISQSGGSTKKEKEQIIARYENVENALSGYTQAKQEFIGAYDKNSNSILRGYHFDEDKNAYVVEEAFPLEGSKSEATDSGDKKGFTFKSEKMKTREVNAETMRILLNQYGNQLEDQNFGDWEVVKSLYDKWGDESRIDQGGADNKVESVTTINPYAQPVMENGKPKLNSQGNPITSYGAKTHAFTLINAANGIGDDDTANKLLMEGGEYTDVNGEKVKIDGFLSRYDWSDKAKKDGMSMSFEEADYVEQDHEPIVKYYNDNQYTEYNDDGTPKPMKYYNIDGDRVEAVFDFDEANAYKNFENFTQEYGYLMNIGNRKEKKVSQHIRFNKPSQITKEYFPAGKKKKVTSDSKIQRGVELDNGNGELFVVTKDGVVKWINN